MPLHTLALPFLALPGLPMSTSSPASSELVQHAAQAASRALESSQRLAHDALDRVSSGAHDIAHQTQALALRSSRQLRAQAARVSDGTIGYIKDEPVKSVLIAAAAGAALVCLTRLVWGRNEA
jgi:ElaB/YqjD/DUF883 family membrane-anchored ribosome-binding protein